ncbi:MAG: GNAT family N-acetyltransferase [Eubacterium sp.]|nr:GNAT family N-acetyltransferase [Eubacterium sp.]
MKVGLVCCSNGQQPEQRETINQLITVLSDMGITCVKAQHLYAKDGVFSGTAKERADDVMAFFSDSQIDAVYDISGGDIANEVLCHLDYERIAKTEKMFWGYSDLTTVINAIYAKTGKASVLYQVKHLAGDSARQRRERFWRSVIGGGEELFRFSYTFLQGSTMEGVVVGGNIRCLLKLAGTPYLPSLRGKILLLESLHSSEAQLTAYFSQLEQMGAFDEAAGVLLGTFTSLEKTESGLSPFALLSRHIRADLPVARTPEVGHGADAKAVVIGRFLRLTEIKTKRLLLKPLGLQYLDTVHAYACDPENTKYMLYLPNDSMQETAGFLKNADLEWKREHPSYYEFAILYEHTQVGAVSIYLNADAKKQDGTVTEAEFGWIISKKFWNRGIAFEAAQALLDYARTELGISHFIAHCDSENAGSFRVMEKLGMKKADAYGGRKNKLSEEERIEYEYRM